MKILRYLKVPGAWLAGAIFALHPIQVETVAWITELKNTLSGVFYLSVALAYLKFDRERKNRLYALALGLFILGLLSKSVIATMPVVMLVIFWWKRPACRSPCLRRSFGRQVGAGREKISWKQDVFPLLPFFVVGIVYGLFTAWVERKFIGAEGCEFNFSIIERFLIAGRAIWFYLSKIFWPIDLIFIYPRWNISQTVWWQYLYPVATLVLAGVLWALRNRSRAPLVAFLFFAAMLFPVLGFFNVYPFRYSFVADHFQYLACIGPVALSAAVIEWALGMLKGNLRRFLQPMAYAILLLTLGVLTWRQSGMYSDSETLYRTVFKKNPSCWMAPVHIGMLLEESGRTKEALFYYRKALEINPNSTEAHNNLGTVLLKIGKSEEALTHYRKALEINPNYTEAHNNLGILLAQTGKTDEAITHFKKVLKIDPNEINTLQNLSFALLQKNQLSDATVLLQRAFALATSSGNDTLAGEIAENLKLLYQATGLSDR